jgi:hypothetical protein
MLRPKGRSIRVMELAAGLRLVARTAGIGAVGVPVALLYGLPPGLAWTTGEVEDA